MSNNAPILPKTPLLTVDCVIRTKDGIVLIRRRNPPFQGRFALPGGFVEIGESVQAACSREVHEETGLVTTSLKLIGVYSEPNRDPRRHVVSVAFKADADIASLRAGDDAASVEIIRDWRAVELAFDHAQIVADSESV